MSNGIIDAVRDLARQVPNLGDLVREATAEKIKPPAEVAYIYNGFDDLNLQYLGRYQFILPRHKVTRIDAKPEHREKNENDSDAKHTEYRLIPLAGESIAREIIENRGLQERGLVVFLDGPNVPKALKEEADEAGKRHILTQIEAFKVGRDKARAGIAGYKIKPDPSVYKWMQEYNPDDELFGEGHRKTDSTDKIAEAISILTQFVTRPQQWPTVQTVAGEAPAPATETLPLPRKKPLETDEAYQKRIAEMKGNEG